MACATYALTKYNSRLWLATMRFVADVSISNLKIQIYAHYARPLYINEYSLMGHRVAVGQIVQVRSECIKWAI